MATGGMAVGSCIHSFPILRASNRLALTDSHDKSFCMKGNHWDTKQ